ncbi:MAG TPA: hypothetical protein VN688_16175 [Gemmataceae bacterium]|nr:hypothetical protein [Gemmataceae bacterium]
MIAYNHLLWGGGLFGIGLAIHVLWWRLRRPKDDISALALCLLLLPAAIQFTGGSWLWYAGSIRHLMVDSFLILGFIVSLAAVYIISYPAAQAASPTMLVALRLAQRGEAGMSVKELVASLENADICGETVPRLLDERFACAVEGRLFLAKRGMQMVRVCLAWRYLLGLPEGEG